MPDPRTFVKRSDLADGFQMRVGDDGRLEVRLGWFVVLVEY
jgi:hypothetical protein